MTDCPMELTEINGRWHLWLPEHRAKRAQWSLDNGGWETERLAAMHDVISVAPLVEFEGDRFSPLPPIPRHLVFDIGAEEGDFPALWASWGANVVMVEPNPKVWPNVRAIFEANQLEDRVRGWFVGFAGTEPRAPAWQPSSYAQPGYARAGTTWPDTAVEGPQGVSWPVCAYGEVIGDHGFLALPERPDVPVATIDELADWHGPPTVITLDIEGAELVALRGAERVLSVAKPIVFMSIHLDECWIDRHYEGDTPEAIHEFMEDRGYVGTWLARDHEEHWQFRHPEGR